MKKPLKNMENIVISVQKLTQIHSTKVENIRQINLFMQNKPNFPHFSPKNDDFTEKQTQFKANSNPIKANFGPKIGVAKPIQSQTNPILFFYCRKTAQTNTILREHGYLIIFEVLLCLRMINITLSVAWTAIPMISAI
jgi:hypothetical protein